MSNPPAKKRTYLVLALLLGVGLGLAATFVGLLLMFRTDTRPLTMADLEAARQRWEQHGPKSYDMDVSITGRMPGTVHIEVRDGHVTQMARDGTTPPQSRTWDVWKVEGMFDTLEDELANAENPTGAFDVPVGTVIINRAKLDPGTGVPLKYERLAPGMDYDMAWEVTRLQPKPDTRSQKSE